MQKKIVKRGIIKGIISFKIHNPYMYTMSYFYRKPANKEKSVGKTFNELEVINQFFTNALKSVQNIYLVQGTKFHKVQ